MYFYLNSPNTKTSQSWSNGASYSIIIPVFKVFFFKCNSESYKKSQQNCNVESNKKECLLE